VANVASAAVACAARSSASSTAHMRTLRCATHAAIASRRTTASATIPCCLRAAFNADASRASSGVSSQHSVAHLWGGGRGVVVSTCMQAVSSQHSLAHRARSTRPSSASSAWYAKRAAASPAESAVLGTGRESSHARSHAGSRKTTASAPC